MSRRKSRPARSPATPSQPEDILSEYTIDHLLVVRQNDLLYATSRRKSQSNSHQAGDDADHESLPSESSTLPTDAFPYIVFHHILDSPNDHFLHCTDLLQDWELKACEYSPQHIFPSTRLFFAFLQHFILNPIDQIGKSLVNYGLHLPRGTVDWESFVDFLHEAIFASTTTAVFLLQLTRFDFFAYKNDDEAKRAKFAIVALHCAAMLCPAITRHAAYGRAAVVLRANFDQPFDEPEIERIVRCLCELVRDVPPMNIELLAAMMPLGGVGARIMMTASVRICGFLVRVESDGGSLDAFLPMLEVLARRCKAWEEGDLQIAGIVVGLVERAVVASLKMKVGDQQGIRRIVTALKGLAVAGMGLDEMLLKERLHVTRIQLENIREMVFGLED